MIYITSPYSDPDEEVMQRRYEATLRYCANLVKLSQVIYSPIVHFHPMAQSFDLPRDVIYWRRHNMQMLRLATTLHILQLPGWRDSTGVRAEMTVADSLHTEVELINADIFWDASEVALS